jgi:hypothetical protein
MCHLFSLVLYFLLTLVHTHTLLFEVNFYFQLIKTDSLRYFCVTVSLCIIY